MTIRLGINIDHVATLRNARGGEHPCPVRAARICKEAGADGIVAHLREDRRHIRDRDIERLMAEAGLPLNLEMAATEEMLAIALKHRPMGVCLVPERREELTTEGGLDVTGQEAKLTPYIHKLRDAGMRVSLFVAANEAQIEAVQRTGANAVELHTGAYAHGNETAGSIRHGAQFAHGLGLEVHAGHGLNYDNVGAIAGISEIVELNIGHFLIGESVFVGLKEAVIKMQKQINDARK